MQRLIGLLFILPMLLAILPGSAVGASHVYQAVEMEPDAGSILCPPGVYLSPPEDCLPLGPSETLATLAAQGLPYPERELPNFAPDPKLAEIPFQYYKVKEEGAIIYFFYNLNDAESNETSNMSKGPGSLMYFSYLNSVETRKGTFYYLSSGMWIRSDFGGRVGLYRPFQGELFSSTPRNEFGWVLGEIKSYTSPGFNSPSTNKTYYRYNIVQVYDTQTIDGYDWNLIGPDEWVEARHVGAVTPRWSDPDGITSGRYIDINLAEQTLAVYDEGKLVFATLISTGRDPFWTRPGLFQIYEKKETENMQGAFEADRSDLYYLEDVPWTMYFDDKRALHGAYWHDFFGYATSHGCVNLSLGDSHWLYDWAVNGDQVYVHDPSGKTPTDPSLYGAGAP